MSDEEEKIELRPAKDNPWYEFMQNSIMSDNANGKEHGWHWFWGIYSLLQDKINLEEIQKKLPDEHWLNKTDEKPPKKGSKLRVPDNVLKDSAKSILQSFLEEHRYKKFPDEIDFSKLLFDETVNFSGFIFPLPISFLFSNFSCDVRFIKTFFCGETFFGSAVFCESADFSRAQFKNTVDFYEATFNSTSDFANAEFSFRALFNNTTFVEKVNFGEAKFLGAVVFNNALFCHEAFFASIKTRTHIIFPGTKFKKYVPDFHDAKLYPGVRWDKNVALWPNPTERNDDENKEKYETRINVNQNSYENLASHMKKIDKYHEEHFFYRQGMRCRRVFEPLLINILYWIYDKLADYGYGVGRALFWWFAHIFIGAFLIWDKTKDVTCSILTSFANAHGFLPLHSRSLKECYKPFMTNDFLNDIWTFQTIAGIPLLFLLLLTLRIRFRLK